jgi:LysR family glycine cleavage system transcriptional activator
LRPRSTCAFPADLARATLIHSVNALTWSDYLRRIGRSDVRPSNELWLDRSTIAIDAAVAGLGLGVVLESALLAEQELRDCRLVQPFDDQAFGVDAESYFLVRPPGFRNGTQVGKFETWLRLSIKLGADQG